MTWAFLAVLVVALIVAAVSARGHSDQRAEDFFVASGQFGAVLFFFLAVGETYSIATMLGFPAGVVARGAGFINWFVGYILLSFPVGYFLYPLIWRAGRRHGAVTLPDLFRGHFGSRALELLVAGTSLTFLLPLGVAQFVGLETVFADLGWSAPMLVLTGLGGLLAFATIAISGIRAPAHVAVLKDFLVLAAILTTGVACLRAGPAAGAVGSLPAPVSQTGDVFAMSTILLQAVGFCVVPQTCASVFTARSASSLRRAQVAMPLYMVMFPFLVAIAWFARDHHLPLRSPNDAFLAAARALLPGWVAGLVMAGAALSALVVLAGICLALGPLVTRNLVPDLDGARQLAWSKMVIAFYLLLCVAGASHSTQLIVAFNNLFYFGVAQALPGVLAVAAGRQIAPVAIGAGLAAGDMVAIGLHLAGVDLGGINPGLIGLVANFAIVAPWFWSGRVAGH